MLCQERFVDGFNLNLFKLAVENRKVISDGRCVSNGAIRRASKRDHAMDHAMNHTMVYRGRAMNRLGNPQRG